MSGLQVVCEIVILAICDMDSLVVHLDFIIIPFVQMEGGIYFHL